jgi:hypothetical protein
MNPPAQPDQLGISDDQLTAVSTPVDEAGDKGKTRPGTIKSATFSANQSNTSLS